MNLLVRLTKPIISFCSILLILTVTSADLLSSATIESCRMDSSTGTSNLESIDNCQEKLVMLLSVPNNQLNTSQTLVATLTDVNETDGSVRKLEDVVKIGISKSETRYNYPLVYKQDFNFLPYEAYVESNLFTCSDDLYDNSPDCGWAMDSNNQRITNSQGF